LIINEHEEERGLVYEKVDVLKQYEEISEVVVVEEYG
jgi:hypothetical protein